MITTTADTSIAAETARFWSRRSQLPETFVLCGFATGRNGGSRHSAPHVDHHEGGVMTNITRATPLHAHIWDREPQGHYGERIWRSERLFEEERFGPAGALVFDPAAGWGRILRSAAARRLYRGRRRYRRSPRPEGAR